MRNNEITQESVSDYLDFKDILENRITEIACIVRDNDMSVNVSCKGSVTQIEINDIDINVKFEEYWQYGGYDSDNIIFPIEFIYKTNDELLAFLQLKNEPLKKEQANRKVIAEREQLKADKAQLKALQAKIKASKVNS